jgi:pimeloyl-ACP methyl ester carboxylesterase
MNLFYKTFGTAPNYILILHGLYGSSDNWQSIAKQLADNHTVIVPDLRNHGRSPHSAIHSYESISQDITDLLDELNIEEVTLIGHSMGGKAAMTFAIQFPEKVKKLIVVDIAPRAYQRLTEASSQVSEHLNILSGLLAIDTTSIASRSHADNLLAAYVSDIKTRQFLLKNLIRKDDHFEWALNIAGLRKNIPLIMGNIPVKGQFDKPTLFIKGELSNYIKESDNEIIKSMFSKAEITTIFDASHWVHAEQPEAFMAAVNSFINNNI